jgi:hypothetical protein
MEEEDDFGGQDEQDDADLEDSGKIKMEVIGSVERDPEERPGGGTRGSTVISRSLRLHYQASTFSEEPMDMDYQRSGPTTAGGRNDRNLGALQT